MRGWTIIKGPTFGSRPEAPPRTHRYREAWSAIPISTWHEAMQLAHKIPDDDRRAWALCGLAENLAKADHFEGAREVLQGITSSIQYVLAVSTYVICLGRIQDRQRLERIVLGSRKWFPRLGGRNDSNSLYYSGSQAEEVLPYFVEALARAGLIRIATSRARRIPELRLRSEAIMNIAIVVKEHGNNRLFRRVISEAEAIIRVPPDGSGRSSRQAFQHEPDGIDNVVRLVTLLMYVERLMSFDLGKWSRRFDALATSELDSLEVTGSDKDLVWIRKAIAKACIAQIPEALLACNELSDEARRLYAMAKVAQITMENDIDADIKTILRSIESGIFKYHRAHAGVLRVQSASCCAREAPNFAARWPT